MTEREWDRRLHIKTIGREDESDPDCSPYEPTPYAVLERLMASGHLRRRDWLLDYGCGKGRVACFMAAGLGCRVTGIDYSRKLIDIAAQNRRSSRTGDRVVLACCRAEQYAVSDESAFFFFNPFSERIFEAVLRRLARSWQAKPRPMKLICYYPSDAYIQCLESVEGLQFVDSIDTNDLFSTRHPRERLVIYAFSAAARPSDEG